MLFRSVHPPQGCNTGAVFSELSKQLACDLPAKSPSDLLKLLSEESALATESPPQQSQRSEKLASMLYNALESAAKRTSDWVQRTSYQLEQHQPVGHCLTGSGSARFCLCSGQAQAETLSEILRKEGDLRVYTFRTWNTPSISQQWSEMHRDGHY